MGAESSERAAQAPSNRPPACSARNTETFLSSSLSSFKPLARASHDSSLQH